MSNVTIDHQEVPADAVCCVVGCTNPAIKPWPVPQRLSLRPNGHPPMYMCEGHYLTCQEIIDGDEDPEAVICTWCDEHGLLYSWDGHVCLCTHEPDPEYRRPGNVIDLPTRWDWR